MERERGTRFRFSPRLLPRVGKPRRSGSSGLPSVICKSRSINYPANQSNGIAASFPASLPMLSPYLILCLRMPPFLGARLPARQAARANRTGECKRTGRMVYRLQPPTMPSASMWEVGFKLMPAGTAPARRCNSAREASANCRMEPSFAGRGFASTARCTSTSSGWRNLILPTTLTTTPPPKARPLAVPASRTSGRGLTICRSLVPCGPAG